ncbi:MAG: O-antigen ligase family protein [Methylococcales bacterium]|nr:O-antigen ligase family protein [Methylococcales bacterium]
MSFYQSIAEKAHVCCLCFAMITAIAAPISTAITSIACVAMLVMWVLSGTFFSTLKISYQQATGKMILVFYLWLVIGSLYGELPWMETLGILSSWKKLAYTFIVLGLFYHQAWKQRFIYSYVIFMAAAALLAVFLWIIDLNIRTGAGHSPGIFMTNYATQSTAFIAALLASIFLFQQTISRTMKHLLAISIGLFIVNIFFISGARTAYFALPIAIVFAIGSLYSFRKLPLIIVMATVVLFALITTSNTLQQRVNEGIKELKSYDTSPHISSIGVRVIFVQNTLELIKKQPLLGYGTASFKPVYEKYVAQKYTGWRALPTTDPHNIYLYITLENGLIGLVLFLSYLFVAFRQGLQQGIYGKIAVSFLMAITVSCLFNSYFKTFPEGHLLAFFMGILLSYKKPESKSTHV